jgi:hypothetical protein
VATDGVREATQSRASELPCSGRGQEARTARPDIQYEMEVDADADAVWGRGSGSARWNGWREPRKLKDATMRAKCISDAAFILRDLIQ